MAYTYSILCLVIIALVVVQTRSETEPLVVSKCRDYSRYVYSNVTVLENNEAATIKTTDRCGHLTLPLIVGVTSAVSGEFPHMALLGYQQLDGKIIWSNGGSLISTRYVLTAGNTLKLTNNGNVSHVRLGELVLNDETDDAAVIDIQIERIIVHPDYVEISEYNDIALLKLAQKVIISPYIRPICLPSVNLEPTRSILSSWGQMEFRGDTSDNLLKHIVDDFNNTECSETYNHVRRRILRNGILETQLCAGSTDEEIGCGLNGEPLQIYHPDIYCMYTQVGVLSYGIQCGTTYLPHVYTRVYSYVPWIVSIIWAAGEDD